MKVGAFGLSGLHPYIQAEISVGTGNGWSYDGDPRIMFEPALDINGEDGSRDPQIGGLKALASSWSLFFLDELRHGDGDGDGGGTQRALGPVIKSGLLSLSLD